MKAEVAWVEYQWGREMRPSSGEHPPYGGEGGCMYRFANNNGQVSRFRIDGIQLVAGQLGRAPHFFHSLPMSHTRFPTLRPRSPRGNPVLRVIRKNALPCRSSNCSERTPHSPRNVYRSQSTMSNSQRRRLFAIWLISMQQARGRGKGARGSSTLVHPSTSLTLQQVKITK